MAAGLVASLSSVTACRLEQGFSAPLNGLHGVKSNARGMTSSLHFRRLSGRRAMPKLGVYMMSDPDSKGHQRRDSPPGASGTEAPTGVYTTTVPLPQGSDKPVAERIAYICQDCGYVYSDETPFEDVPDSFNCPVCTAPKSRFTMANASVGETKDDDWSKSGQLN